MRFEQPVGLTRKSKESDPFVHIGATRIQMAGHVTLATINLVAPLDRHPAVEVVADGPIKLVDVDAFQSVP
ncbi:hypothetical protein [Sphingobium fluviale]|uniref:Uncharacterized protein n=1 Tax=Sphingobium fluviale TaxID=2506423 RepID=A0A4Q1KPC8_9SPHN|nr:hypothetical protein [Sphingobium fluviale]RXR30744.1 hypothetical protein EQG66_00045 [Sphingobium fluviale]